MKYPPVRLAMPDGVCEWLERELEQRGIDAVVYTRYVLSLLRREPIHLTDLAPTIDALRHGGKRRAARCDLEQLRRTAAVDCLSSACDEKCGIESLVDELCQKLKDIESEPVGNVCTTAIGASRQNGSDVDLAAKYYAAFPALGTTRHYQQQQHILQTGEPVILAGDEGYSTNSDHETCDTVAPEQDDLDLEYEDLPVDIRGLLASPVTPPTAGCRHRTIPPVQQPYIRCGTNITSSIWSQDAEDCNVASGGGGDEHHVPPRWSDGGDRRTVSLIQLNHCEASSFAEVLPGATAHYPVIPPPVTSTPAVVAPAATEEDLLTSTRTHFKPIKQETAATYVQTYADGTTFAIRGSLEEVPYVRSASGTLCLQGEPGTDPDRYLEWRPSEVVEREGSAFVPRFRVQQIEKCCQTNDENAVTKREPSATFVPHFRIQQIEKCCQTEDENEEENGWDRYGGDAETPPHKKRVLSEASCEDDLLFPAGECELLLQEQWVSAGGGCARCAAVGDVWGSACPSCAPPIPSEAPGREQCGDLRRLRDELSLEGDQLLSDLQRVVLVTGAALGDAPAACVPPRPTPADYRKRRHSGAAVRVPWHHLQHHLLRPVTL